MREARRPGVYQTFFGSEQTGWVSTGGDLATGADTFVPVGNSVTQPATDQQTDLKASGTDVQEQRSKMKRSLGHWVDSMDLPLQRAWIESLVLLKNQSSPDVQTPSVETHWTGLTVDQVDGSGERLMEQSEWFDPAEIAGILSALDTLKVAAESGAVPPGLWQSVQDWAVAMLDELDRAAMARVVDGTFWTGADSDAFYLQLARAAELPETGAVTTGTLPLLQQPDIYRGQRVGVVGTLQLAEQLQAANNRVEIQHYWKLWIIPSDGGIRPTVLITPQLPAAIAAST